MRSVRRSLALAVAGTVVLAVGAGGVAWSQPREERRLGRLVARALGDRTGLAMSVDRARVAPARLVLSGIRIDPGPELPLALTIGSLEIAVEPTATREHPLSTIAARWDPGLPVAAIVTPVAALAAPETPTTGTRGIALPDAPTIERVRERLLAVMGWPGGLRVRLMDGELRRGGVTYAFGVRGEKLPDGTLDLTVEVSEGRPATPPSFSVRARVSAPAGRAPDAPLDVALDGRVDPASLARVWPGALPRPAALATRSTLTLRPGGDVQAAGRFTVGRPEAPALVDFTARYEGRSGRLSVARYAVDWKPGVAIEGAASLEADGRLTATATGAVDAGRLDGRISYAPSGALQGHLTVAPLRLEALAARLGVTAVSAQARSLTARVSGALGGRLSLEARARELTLGALPAVALDAALDATSSTPRARDGATPLPRVDAATLSLARQGQTLAVVKGSSRGAALWPLALDGSIAELARVAPLLPWPATLEGAARFTGVLTREDALRFEGTLQAEMPRAETTTGTKVALAGTRARIPVLWTGGPGPPGTESGRQPGEPDPGSLFVERVAAFGFELNRVIGTARVADDRLRLPDLAWTHYGGHGGGWLELALAGDPVPLRSRVAGERVDLAEVVRAFGSDVARVTGRVGYQFTALYAHADGLVVLGQVTSEGNGGEIGIDVLEQLLETPAVQVESSGVLRQTLQNLRRFDYESLAGEFRWSNGAGFIDLTLRGKKRLGIFPGPVEAINIKNMPLSVLTRALARRPSP